MTPGYSLASWHLEPVLYWADRRGHGPARLGNGPGPRAAGCL